MKEPEPPMNEPQPPMTVDDLHAIALAALQKMNYAMRGTRMLLQVDMDGTAAVEVIASWADVRIEMRRMLKPLPRKAEK